MAREHNVKVVASNHDFEKTPGKKELIDRLCHMQNLGADILKIAVMPKDKKDVLTLLSATEEMNRMYASRPIITMSMSGTALSAAFVAKLLGRQSRLLLLVMHLRQGR